MQIYSNLTLAIIYTLHDPCMIEFQEVIAIEMIGDDCMNFHENTLATYNNKWPCNWCLENAMCGIPDSWNTHNMQP